MNRHQSLITSHQSLLPLLVILLTTSAHSAEVKTPLERSAYFSGEKVLLSAAGETDKVKVELTDAAGKPVVIYEGRPGTFVLDTAKLAPGTYSLDGKPFYVTPVARPSVASWQDEGSPQIFPKGYTASKPRAELVAQIAPVQDALTEIFRETGLTAVMGMTHGRTNRAADLDVYARSGVFYFNNPDGRPLSFNPVKEDPAEREGMSQRMLQTAQLHTRFPNFGGFIFGFDTCGFSIGGRKMLLIYWGWGGQDEALRNYLDRQDRMVIDEFKKQTGLEWVSAKEYLGYSLSLGRSDLTPVFDLPTVRWVEAIAPKMPKLPPEEKAALEKRLDAWAAYLMTLYGKNFAIFQQNLRAFDPTLKNTASVQIDHAPARDGQYFPTAYRPLDFRYQSTWNDQIDGPDYLFQPLFTGGILNMDRPENTRVWISGAIGPVHGKAAYPGKMARSAAHNLANGVSGLGLALEGFSSLFSMNHYNGWSGARDKAAGFDIASGKEFLDRFAWLAVAGRGDYGAGVLFSKTQLGRLNVTQGFGKPQFNAFVTLARLGYTPVFLTEEEIAAKQFRGVKSIVIPGQVVPLPEAVLAGLRAFAAQGGRVLTDRETTADVAATGTLEFAMPQRLEPGKPHNYGVPGQSPNRLWPEMYAEYAPAFERGLNGLGHAAFRPESGVKSDVTLSQIQGGADASYVVAVNDSMVATQADWRQVKEKLIPAEGVAGFLYDLTEEKALGQAGPVEADLTQTTARVYGLLPRKLGAANLKATQRVTAGEKLGVAVGFNDAAGQALAGVLPFHLTVTQPDGKVFFAGYRGTDAAGRYSVSLDLPVNLPAGQWTVAVRSQLDGSVSTLPVTVSAAKAGALAAAISEPVLVREKAVIEQSLAKGRTVLLPLFGSQVEELGKAAKRIRQALAARGVTVKILENPEFAEYTQAYDPTPEQLAQNAVVAKGEAIGKVNNLSVNGNDWFGSNVFQSRYPILLLKVAGGGENPIIEALEKQLWPRVREVAPVSAVVQGVAWAFGTPESSAVVIDAADAAGIDAAADRLAKLPEDFLTQSVRDARARLFAEFHLGGTPAGAPEKGLTQAGLAAGKAAPAPFRIPFGDSRPPAPGENPPAPAKPETPPLAVPGFAQADAAHALLKYQGQYVPANLPARRFANDLRFSDALDFDVDVPQAGPVEITIDGIFRYSDRRPRTQATWEDYLVIWDQYVKGPRQPMSFTVLVDGQLAGKLDRITEEQREIAQNTPPKTSGEKPKVEIEAVAVSLSGTVNLPAGAHRLRLIPANIVDGSLVRIRLGVTREAAEIREAEIKQEEAAQKAAKQKT